jgi:hypothetical protein
MSEMLTNVMSKIKRWWIAVLAGLHRLVVDSGAQIDAGTPGARHPLVSHSDDTRIGRSDPASNAQRRK